MNVNDMLRQLREERDRIDSAITALSSLDDAGAVTNNSGTTPGAKRGRRRMSAAARKRRYKGALGSPESRCEDGAGESHTRKTGSRWDERSRPQAHV
jgi:hypothetical protein